MLKTLITLVRGRTALIAEEVADQNALLILDQQMRDATGALDRAKKGLAVAIAQENQEGQRLDATHSRIADLETRAVAAIEAGRVERHGIGSGLLHGGRKFECQRAQRAGAVKTGEHVLLR